MGLSFNIKLPEIQPYIKKIKDSSGEDMEVVPLEFIRLLYETLYARWREISGELDNISGSSSSSLTMATNRVLGRTTAGTGVPEELTVTAPLALTTGAIGTSIATSKLVGRTTAGAGAMEEIAAGTGLLLSGLTLSATGGAAVQTLNSKSANYTTVLADANNGVLHPSTDDNPRVFTIDSNANVAYPTGTLIEFENEVNQVQLKVTSDTFGVAGFGALAGLNLVPFQTARARKTASTRWLVETNPPGLYGTTLLIGNDNQANNSTTFNDQSIYARTIGAGGNTKYTTSNPPTGMTSSLTFDGVDDNLSCVGYDGFLFGALDFTVEMYVRFASVTGTQSIFEGRPPIAGSQGWLIYASGTGLRVFYDNADQVTAAGVLSLNTWYHIAWSRNNGANRLYKDGTQIGSTVTACPWLPQAKLYFGTDYASTSDFNGQMCSIRVTRGWGRYPANFTPPSLPLSATA